MVIGIVIFLLFGLLTKRYTFSFNVRLIAYGILCLLVLNSIPFFAEGKFLTLEAINNLAAKKYEFSNAGVHVVVAISFVLM